MDALHSQTQLQRGSVCKTVHRQIITVNLPLSGHWWPGWAKTEGLLAFAGANNNRSDHILVGAVNSLSPNSDEQEICLYVKTIWSKIHVMRMIEVITTDLTS